MSCTCPTPGPCAAPGCPRRPAAAPANDAGPLAYSAYAATLNNRPARLAMLTLQAVKIATATRHPRGTLLLFAQFAEEAAVEAGAASDKVAREQWIATAEELCRLAGQFPEDPYSQEHGR